MRKAILFLLTLCALVFLIQLDTPDARHLPWQPETGTKYLVVSCTQGNVMCELQNVGTKVKQNFFVPTAWRTTVEVGKTLEIKQYEHYQVYETGSPYHQN